MLALSHEMYLKTFSFLFVFIYFWLLVMRAKTGAGLFVRNLWLIHPTAAISITARCLAHCQLLLGSQPALPISVPFFSLHRDKTAANCQRGSMPA